MANWHGLKSLTRIPARDAAHMAGLAGVVAGLTTLFALISMRAECALWNWPLSLIDALCFGVVAWRTWCGSRAFAVAGLSLYGLEVLYAW